MVKTQRAVGKMSTKNDPLIFTWLRLESSGENVVSVQSLTCEAITLIMLDRAFGLSCKEIWQLIFNIEYVFYPHPKRFKLTFKKLAANYCIRTLKSHETLIWYLLTIQLLRNWVPNTRTHGQVCVFDFCFY